MCQWVSERSRDTTLETVRSVDPGGSVDMRGFSVFLIKSCIKDYLKKISGVATGLEESCSCG